MLTLLEEAWALALSIVSEGIATLPLDDTGRFLMLLVAVTGVVLIWCVLGAPLEGHFAVLTLLLAFAALLLVLTGSLWLFYLLWEIAAVVCWAIGRLVNRGSDSVLGALPIQGFGGLASLAMFSGVLWLSVEGRTGDFSPVSAEHLPYIAGLILFALLAKSLSVITQSWHEAVPRAGPLASALLATVGVLCLGIYPLVRFLSGPFAAAPFVSQPLLLGGLALAFVAAVAALGERDMYRVASYAALVQLGLVAAGLSRGVETALAPALWGFAAYCATITALYLALGNVERASGTRLLTELGGLAGALPVTVVGAVLAVLGLAAAPPFATFGLASDLGRLLLDRPPGWAIWLLTGALVLQFVALLRLVGRVFGGARSLPRLAEGPWHVVLALLVLGLGSLLIGFDPAPISELVRPFVGRLAG